MAALDVDEEVMTLAEDDTSPQYAERKGSGNQQVHLRADDEFDWETYITPYTGRTRIDRLLFLASRSPSLRIPCSTAAILLIKSGTTDVTLYNRALMLRNTTADAGQPLLPKEQRMPADGDWCEKSQKNNQNELEKLDLELRHYQNNLIKESVRMTHRDLGDHLRSMGNLTEALKYYIKTRDHCSTSEHVVEMCLNVIEVSLELGEFHSISAYVSKAEGLLDSYNPLAAASSSSKSTTLGRSGSGVPPSKGGSTSGADAIGALFRAGGSAGANQSASLSSATAQLSTTTTAAGREAEAQGKRQIAEIRSRLNVAQGIAYLGMSKYNLAKSAFLDVDLSSSDAFSNMASRIDIAMYIVLCSLAVLDRKEVKEVVLNRPNIGAILDSDSQARALLDWFLACEYQKTLALLGKMASRSMLDMHLSSHYPTLVDQITRRALRQFLQPFDSLRIDRLASSMGWSGKQGQERAIDQLIALIQNNEIDGKIDVIDKVYYANKIDFRQSLFDEALSMGQQRATSAKRLLMRMNLTQSK
ncbi:hypothetical protein CBS101457_001558 [Exobasidium rhododendri]|nr:hypothetical protein CBS101457_001558 [Exobasidium rhododendri]